LGEEFSKWKNPLFRNFLLHWMLNLAKNIEGTVV
jgi:hypothetical protein